MKFQEVGYGPSLPLTADAHGRSTVLAKNNGTNQGHSQGGEVGVRSTLNRMLLRTTKNFYWTSFKFLG